MIPQNTPSKKYTEIAAQITSVVTYVVVKRNLIRTKIVKEKNKQLKISVISSISELK